MAERTLIEWADATISWWWGCTEVSPGCANCYARTLAARFGQPWGRGAPRTLKKGPAELARRLNRKAKRQGRTIRVFSASMSDWLDADVPAAWLADLLLLVHETQALTWMLLTKRPELWRARLEAALVALEDGQANPREPGAAIATANMIRAWLAGDAPAHVWVGTTVEDQQRADERVPALLAIPARVRFLSAEPLLGPVDLGLNAATCTCCRRLWPSRWVRLHRPIGPDLAHLLPPGDHVADVGIYRAHSNPHGALSVETPGGRLGIKPGEFDCLGGIDWIICGGESGRGARPTDPAWLRSLLEQAKAAGVPAFVKQLGGHPDKRGDLKNFPVDLQVRELPEVARG